MKWTKEELLPYAKLSLLLVVLFFVGKGISLWLRTPETSTEKDRLSKQHVQTLSKLKDPKYQLMIQQEHTSIQQEKKQQFLDSYETHKEKKSQIAEIRKEKKRKRELQELQEARETINSIKDKIPEETFNKLAKIQKFAEETMKQKGTISTKEVNEFIKMNRLTEEEIQAIEESLGEDR